MFTGLITAIGRISRLADEGGGIELEIEAGFDDLHLGESVAVDGACLTVATIGQGCFVVHVVNTTSSRTRFADLSVGDRVNLERALKLGERLGGHLVQGHVDGVGEVVSVRQEQELVLVDIRIPPTVAEVCIPLGSVTVNGVSMTINSILEPELIQLAIVPFTLEHTTLGDCQAGATVHLEGDLVGKHVRSMAEGWRRVGQQ